MTCFQFIKKFLLFDCTTADRKRGKLIVAGFVQFCGNIVPGLPLLAVVEIFVKVDDGYTESISAAVPSPDSKIEATLLQLVTAACSCCVFCVSVCVLPKNCNPTTRSTENSNIFSKISIRNKLFLECVCFMRRPFPM